MKTIFQLYESIVGKKEEIVSGEKILSEEISSEFPVEIQNAIEIIDKNGGINIQEYISEITDSIPEQKQTWEDPYVAPEYFYTFDTTNNYGENLSVSEFLDMLKQEKFRQIPLESNGRYGLEAELDRGADSVEDLVKMEGSDHNAEWGIFGNDKVRMEHGDEEHNDTFVDENGVYFVIPLYASENPEYRKAMDEFFGWFSEQGDV